jgi:hypothetical protein
MQMSHTQYDKFSFLFVSILLAGCSASSQVTHSPRSSIEQRLLVRSLDRSLNQLDTLALQGRTVAVDFYGLTPDKDFAKEFCIAWLQGRKIRVVTDPPKAEVRLKIFAPALAVDRGQAFFGVPAVTVPFLGFTVPELALFKSATHEGYAEIQMYVIDSVSGDFLTRSPRSIGEAAYNQYTILILINFKLSDLDEPEDSVH